MDYIDGIVALAQKEILDVGCGGGLLTEAMAARGAVVTGIDLSEGMLGKAKERAEMHRLTHVQLHRMDAGAMEFADNSFDTVVAAYVVTAVPDHRKVVNEMIRVCRPGGRIIMLNHFSNDNKLIATMEKVISPLTKHLGWRTDLSLHTVLEGTSLHVARKQNVNPLRFWALVECVNGKNGQGVKNGNGTAVHSNGHVNSTAHVTEHRTGGNGHFANGHSH